MADHSNLPAPYESPWRQLGRAAAAVLASLRLDLRSLWRRNRDGELTRPAWWPRDLAPLFWPLVLAGALTLLVAVGTGLIQRLQRPPAPPAPVAERPADVGPTADLPALLQDMQPIDPQQAAPQATPPPPLELQPAQPPDPLLAAFAQGEGQTLIAAATAQPELGLLQLQLSPAYDALGARQQRRWAETWLQQSLELGFEQLVLLDGDGQTVGYRARVGSGMILLDPDNAS
jgi:hypothetical protein